MLPPCYKDQKKREMAYVILSLMILASVYCGKERCLLFALLNNISDKVILVFHFTFET